jgi:hypothetical protein
MRCHHSTPASDAIPEPAGFMSVHGDPDFLAALRMNKQHMAAFACALFDEASRLQLADDCGRPRIPLEMQRLVVGRLAHTGYAVRASQHNARHPTVYRRPSETLIGLSTVVGASGVYAHEHC